MCFIKTRVSGETSFVSYFAKHEAKQVSYFAKQTCYFAKFRYEAKQAVSARFVRFITNLYQILSFIKKIAN
jgi:hypothetical protein